MSRLDWSMTAQRRLRAGHHVDMPVGDGWLHIDRPLPFLFVHRRRGPAKLPAERLVWSQASFLVAPTEDDHEDELRDLISTVVQEVEEVEGFGSFLVIELWTVAGSEPFVVTGPSDGCSSVNALASALAHVDVSGHMARVDTRDGLDVAPPGRRPLLTEEDRRTAGVVLIGLQIPEFFVDDSGAELPLVFRRLQHDVSRALRSAAFEFATVETTLRPADVHELGPRRLDDRILAVDQQLAGLATRVDYLLSVTPVDSDLAWRSFEATGYRDEPTFHYRPLPFDPDLMKRALYEIPVEEVEDPTLAAMFREKRYELDTHIDLMAHRGAAPFLHLSRTLFGDPEPALVELASQILDRVTAHRSHVWGSPRASTGEPVDGPTFAARAREEIDRYEASVPGLAVPVELRDDINGIMVSNGRLLVDTRLRLAPRRVEALIQHEVGTHVVTWVNGGHQALNLLRVGLPGYEEAQEALAVIAEHVVGGLTPPRMGTLAARVVATDCLVQGGSFVEAFEHLNQRETMSPSALFDVVMRVYRCGGLTKDVIYLRGLVRLVEYLATGASLDPLLVGKLSLEYVPTVEELCWRQVVTPPVVQPRWLTWPGATERIERLRRGAGVMELLPEVS